MTEMSAVTYLEDVAAELRWIHHLSRLRPSCSTPPRRTGPQLGGHGSVGLQVLDHIKTEIQPLEFTGKAGDVIFCHGWMVHSAGHPRDRRVSAWPRCRTSTRFATAATCAGRPPARTAGRRINGDMDGVFTFEAGWIRRRPGGRLPGGHQPVDHGFSNEFVLARHAPFEDMFRGVEPRSTSGAKATW